MVATILCLCIIVLCSACRPKPWKLAEQGDVQGLIDILSDSSETLERRNDAAYYLGTIGSPLAVDPLIQTMLDFLQLESEQVMTDDWSKSDCAPISGLVSAAADSLGEIGDLRAVDSLIAALETISENSAGQHRCTQKYSIENVAQALGKLGDAKAAVALLSHPDLPAAQNAFQSIDRPCTETLVNALTELRDQDPNTYLKVADLLAEETDPRCHTALVDTLIEASPGLWTRLDVYVSFSLIAADLLAEETDPRVRSFLEGELTAPNDLGMTQSDAAWALAKFLRYDADQLLPYLGTEATASLFYDVLIKIGKPGTEPALIAALNEFGYEKMALDYYQCDNEALHDAAFQWFYARDLRVMSLSNYYSCDPCWGEGTVESRY
jgi:hypothetical protein